MRYTVSNVLLFLLCTFFGCAWLKLFNERTKDAMQLGFFGAGEEVTRFILSRRLGWTVEIPLIITAAAPLDWLLSQGSPSWDLFGVGPCDPRRGQHTELGRCKALQAHACYLYAASMPADFQGMADCHDLFPVSAGEAKSHTCNCHRQASLPWEVFEACLASKMSPRNQYLREDTVPSAMTTMWTFAKLYGVQDQLLENLNKVSADGSKVEVHVTSHSPSEHNDSRKCRKADLYMWSESLARL